MKVRVADFITSHLRSIGVPKIFMLNGGMMMHLVDTLGRKNGLDFIAQHHEQACAMAADGYARRSGKLGVCYATSGPGATNLITGIVGAWQDSTPTLFITGQSKSTETIEVSGIENLRQFGTFEVNIVPVVKSITKYSLLIDDPKMIRFHLEKAIFLATSGRTGPVLLDIPLDIQGSMIETDELQSFTPCAKNISIDSFQMTRLVSLLENSKRPLILAGHGIRCSGSVEKFNELIDKIQIPVVTSQLGKDCIHYDHSMFIGHPGPKGDRAGNFAIQTADLIISLGCSLHSQTTGWEIELFAPNAQIVQVELDAAVISRQKIEIDLSIQTDVNIFVDDLLGQKINLNNFDNWHGCCASWKRRFKVFNEPHTTSEKEINFYHFAESLSKNLLPNSCVVTDAGSAFYVMGQALRLSEGQRFISSGSLGAMGFALPAANGAAAACISEPTICVTGDGSLMTNLHDLATMKEQNSNLKLFVINNDGYVSMRNTQQQFFDGHLVGADSNSGVMIPCLASISKTFDLPFFRCDSLDILDEFIQNVLTFKGPVVCEIVAQRDQKIIPSVTSIKLADGRMKSSELNNMTPHLDEKVIREEMKKALLI